MFPARLVAVGLIVGNIPMAKSWLCTDFDLPKNDLFKRIEVITLELCHAPCLNNSLAFFDL